MGKILWMNSQKITFEIQKHPFKPFQYMCVFLIDTKYLDTYIHFIVGIYYLVLSSLIIFLFICNILFYVLNSLVVLHLRQTVTSICKVQKQTQNRRQTILKTTSYSDIISLIWNKTAKIIISYQKGRMPRDWCCI